MIARPPAREAWDALVEVVRAVRPEWDAAGVRFGIKQALARPEETTFAQLVTVAVKCAANEKCQTPATFGFDASWTEKPLRADIKKTCWTCGYSERGHDMLAAHEEPKDRHPFITYEDRIAAMSDDKRGPQTNLPLVRMCEHDYLARECPECSRQPKEAPAHLSATTEETA